MALIKGGLEGMDGACGWCRTTLGRDEEHAICRECGTLHHRECSVDFGECSKVGCGSDLFNYGRGVPEVAAGRKGARKAGRKQEREEEPKGLFDEIEEGIKDKIAEEGKKALVKSAKKRGLAFMADPVVGGGIMVGAGALLLVANKLLVALAVLGMAGWGVYSLVTRKEKGGAIALGMAVATALLFWWLGPTLIWLAGLGIGAFGGYKLFMGLKDKKDKKEGKGEGEG